MEIINISRIYGSTWVTSVGNGSKMSGPIHSTVTGLILISCSFFEKLGPILSQRICCICLIYGRWGIWL